MVREDRPQNSLFPPLIFFASIHFEIVFKASNGALRLQLVRNVYVGAIDFAGLFNLQDAGRLADQSILQLVHLILINR